MKSLCRHAFWLAPLITFLGFVSYYLIFANYPALRDFPWINLPLVLFGAALAIGSIGCIWKNASRFRKVLHLLAAVFSAAIAGLLIHYVFILSSQMPEETETTRSLREAPDFTLVAADGEERNLADYRGE
ncbi:MAG: hypothetical protein AAGC68_17325, partial [Verrucomicrobiota bacterium]